MGRLLPVLATGCIVPRHTGLRVMLNVLTLQKETAKTADAGCRLVSGANRRKSLIFNFPCRGIPRMVIYVVAE